MLILSQARGKKYGKRRRRLEAGVPRGALQTPASRQSKGISTCPQRGYPLARKGDIPFCTRGISLLRERGYPLLHEGDILFARKGISLLRTRRVRPLEASLEMRSMAVSRFFLRLPNPCATARARVRTLGIAQKIGKGVFTCRETENDTSSFVCKGTSFLTAEKTGNLQGIDFGAKKFLRHRFQK